MTTLFIQKLWKFNKNTKKNQDKFGFVVFIGKTVCYAGLRDVAIESGVITIGSVGKVLDGKTFKRAI